MYKTGDLARYLPDGNVMWLGRKDLQVKINGLRIELPEIESVIYEYSQIKEAVVVFHPAKNPGQQGKLLAYVETCDKQKLNRSGLQDFLRIRLHRYMIPSRFVQIEKIPLTVSGKIDRKRLRER